MHKVIQSTQHQHIVRNRNICGGQPIIKGTRTSVRSVVGYYKMGFSVEEMLEGLPHLTPAQIHDALSYYFDHPKEIERDIKANSEPQILKRHGYADLATPA